MKRKVGIDYGRCRIGLAVESPVCSFAMPFTTILQEKSIPKTIEKILLSLERVQPIASFILGLPLLFSGQDNPFSLEVRAFAKQLYKLTHISVILWDERLTTKQAEAILKSANVKRKKRNAITDPIAATLILQSYLDSLAEIY